MLLYCNENMCTILALSLDNTSINNKLNKNKCRETKTLAHKLNRLFNKSKKANVLLLQDVGFFLLRIKGGVLKSMLASDVAIIDIKEHQIEYFKVIIKLF